MRPTAVVLPLAALAAALLSTSLRLEAQGPRARVQLAPLCNVLTLSVVEDAHGLAAAGVDDHCGQGAPTPVSGRAVRNADGMLRMSLYVQDGRAVQMVSLQLEAGGRAGTWQDTAGRAGVATPPGERARPRSARAANGMSGVTGRLATIASPTLGNTGPTFVPQTYCKYGREFFGFLGIEIPCGDVVTPLAFGAADMALGSDGNPIFVGPGVAGAGVVVTRCGNPACSAGNTPVPLSATGSGPRIAIGLDGLPVVATLSAGTVTVIKCGNLDCTSGSESTVSTSALRFTLVIGSDGLPLVVGTAAGLLRVIHCGDAACASGNTTEDVPLPDGVVVDPSVAIAPDGFPVIAFRYDVPLPYPQVEDGVKLLFCADLTCSTGRTSGPLMVNTLSVNNKFCCGLSLAIGSDGLPIVASHRMFWGVWTAHCDDSTCNTSASGTKIDDGTLPGISVRLLIGARGVPVISHHGGNDWKLKVTECRDVACTGFNHPTRTFEVSAPNGPAVLGSEGLPILSNTGSIIACGTKGCLPPAPAVAP